MFQYAWPMTSLDFFVAAYSDAGLSTRSSSLKGCFWLRPYTLLLLAYTTGIGFSRWRSVAS